MQPCGCRSAVRSATLNTTWSQPPRLLTQEACCSTRARPRSVLEGMAAEKWPAAQKERLRAATTWPLARTLQKNAGHARRFGGRKSGRPPQRHLRDTLLKLRQRYDNALLDYRPASGIGGAYGSPLSAGVGAQTYCCNGRTARRHRAPAALLCAAPDTA